MWRLDTSTAFLNSSIVKAAIASEYMPLMIAILSLASRHEVSVLLESGSAPRPLVGVGFRFFFNFLLRSVQMFHIGDGLAVVLAAADCSDNNGMRLALLLLALKVHAHHHAVSPGVGAGEPLLFAALYLLYTHIVDL